MSRALVLPLLLLAAPAFAQEAAQDFKTNCSSCHTIGGGRLTGPDLKHVEQRQKREWLLRFIADPPAMVQSGDPYALKLFEEARNVQMPLVAGMTKARAEALLDLIAAESELEKSQFMGLQLSDRPFTPADVARGRDIFLGRVALVNGGAPCISCHTTGDLSFLSGGRLGPDLTKVFERYETRRKLGAWLGAPATATMQPVFRAHPLDGENEILPLVAYFQELARNDDEDRSAAELIFLLFGLGGAAGCLVLANRIWRNRFRGVRRRLVEGAQA